MGPVNENIETPVSGVQHRSTGDEPVGESTQNHCRLASAAQQPKSSRDAASGLSYSLSPSVVYEIYPRSFADGNGDGTGDLPGVRSRLPYLAELGVDALWFTPWYRSPQADGGYDVADYRAIDAMFGTLDDAEALITEARDMGIRTIVDLVPHHVSSDHAWFRAALAAGPGAPARDRFWFRDGRGHDNELPPNHWESIFGGSAWSRTTDPDGTKGQWYLHLFASEQPDLNWEHPDVSSEYEEVLRFWFDRGVAGIRIDSATMGAKDRQLPDVTAESPAGDHPYLDRDDVHDVYRAWRKVADSYEEPRILVGEVWLANHQRFARYLRADELHMAFNFDFMARPWNAPQLRESITATLAAHVSTDAPPTWVLSNHDVTRPTTRFGRTDSSFSFEAKRFGVASDLELGTRRARAAALLTAALPGVLYIYQGDELGLPEVESLDGHRRDPMHHRSNGANPGRDGCRVPLPWNAHGTSCGFSPDDATAEPWLPQPDDWCTYAVDEQRRDPSSMLNLYRRTLALRRTEADLQTGAFAWSDDDHRDDDRRDDVLAFQRGDDLTCVVNLGSTSIDLPPHSAVLLTSNELDDGRLPGDTAAWLRPPPTNSTYQHKEHT
ncbi:glycoside hydrolase family 13 protein [soil metagenome]